MHGSETLPQNFTVILVEPKFAGNVGAVARAMHNFGLTKLTLVNPCELSDEAYQRAKHAAHILDNSMILDSFAEAVERVDFVVGTSGVRALSEKHHLRNPISPREFAERIREIRGEIGVVFGREDHGLYNEELKKCDLFVVIPTSDEYPVMNLSHAAAIIFYELFAHGAGRKTTAAGISAFGGAREASGLEKEKLYEQFDTLLESIDYPAHKRERTSIMFRRLMGRALPSKWEFHTLMGVLGRAASRGRAKAGGKKD